VGRQHAVQDVEIALDEVVGSESLQKSSIKEIGVYRGIQCTYCTLFYEVKNEN